MTGATAQWSESAGSTPGVAEADETLNVTITVDAASGYVFSEDFEATHPTLNATGAMANITSVTVEGDTMTIVGTVVVD